MPKYTIEDVLDIIKTFTPEEKITLQSQLATALNSPAGVTPSSRNQQSQSFGNVTLGSGNTFDANQISAEGSVNLARSTNTGEFAKKEIQEALDLLQTLKQGIAQTEKLNVLEKKNAEATISVVEEEITKPKPDKNLLTQAGSALENCCKKVAEFADPALAIANIIAMIV
ncbi:hypothetical protein H6G17_07120 [Chroococcidiopsis sp. FACHB-1243]|uniref:hypothetical protein n=1 Tax=Chroococcidiopsis sp. [FACHB-1243] TaxID=2692781 RepID=UPI00177C1CA3|nr:hypothetical protein [Chroococcidiopsis sp. [FACHB-1243]]MBD2305283.1 hypothetical protein [Chroococcidiopsis sp. [FACHB-1243]]